MTPEHPARRPEELGGPGIRVFSTICGLWAITEEEQARLLVQDQLTFERWRALALSEEPLALPRATLHRLGAFFGVYQGLMIVLATDEARAYWLRTPSDVEPFQGRSPIDLMSAPDLEGMLAVLRYLRGQAYGSPWS